MTAFSLLLTAQMLLFCFLGDALEGMKIPIDWSILHGWLYIYFCTSDKEASGKRTILGALITIQQINTTTVLNLILITSGSN